MELDSDHLLGECLHEEGEDHGPDVYEELIEGDFRKSKDEDADGK